MPHILVRLTATTVQTTLWVASLSAPARGSVAAFSDATSRDVVSADAASRDVVSVDAALRDVVSADAALTDAALADAVASTTAASGAEIMASTVAPAGSTAPAAPAGSAAAVVVSTAAEVACMAAEAATGAADIGNSRRIIQQSAGTAGSKCCQPFFICAAAFTCSWKQCNPAARDSPRRRKSYQGSRKWRGPDSAIAPNFIAYSFLISRYRPLITD